MQLLTSPGILPIRAGFTRTQLQTTSFQYCPSIYLLITKIT